jgi:hypothetical protein
MAHGLEERGPILNHEFVAWVFKVPSSLNFKGNEGNAE